MASTESAPTSAAETVASTIPTHGTVPDQIAEVQTVKIAFPNRCRVICDVGKYSNVITVQPENMDVTIKFQLTVAYPTVVPEITIRSESLTEEARESVQAILMSKAFQLIGQPMIQTLIKEAETELRVVGLKPGKSLKVNSHTFVDEKQKKQRKQKKKPKSEDEVVENKLPSMKTADDVVKRIIWDENLEKDDFVVGYIDRFRGLVEKYFSAFSWEDLAAVDYDVLAVPKHRIQYFKYKNVKVWDKPRRIDNVFGSAEGTKTIDVVIKEVEELERLQGAGAASTVANGNDSVDDDSEDDDDEDSDDGIVVTIGNSGSIGTAFQHAQNPSNEIAGATPEEEAVIKNEYNPYWRDKLRPNYFICVRITSEPIMDQIGRIQDHLMEKEPLFGECCIPGASLHITLNTLGLDTAEQLMHCKNVLEKIKPELEAALPNSPLRLHGVSHFYNRVIYAEVNYKKDFMEFCDLLKMLLKQEGVEIRDGYKFVPHATIIKTNRPTSRIRGTKNIDPQMYAQFSDMHFGEQKIDSIYLCSMENERREDGFYLTPLELHFNS